MTAYEAFAFTARQQDLLGEAHVAILSTTGPGGWPHAAPVWYVAEQGALLVVTGRGSQKHRNLERDRRAAIVVDRKQRPYYALMIRCISEESPAPVAETRRRIAGRYLPAADLENYLAGRDSVDAVVLRFSPTKVVEYGV